MVVVLQPLGVFHYGAQQKNLDKRQNHDILCFGEGGGWSLRLQKRRGTSGHP